MEHKRMPPPYIEEVKEFIKKETLIVITSPGCTCKPLYLCDAGKVEKLGDSDCDYDWSLKKLLLERGIFIEQKKMLSVVRRDWQFIREDLGIDDEAINCQYVLLFACRKI